MVAAGVPVDDRLAGTVDRELAVRTAHLAVAEKVVQQPAVPDLLVARLEERGGARPQADVERETELGVVEAEPLHVHGLDDVEPERPGRELVGPRAQRAGEANVALLDVADDACIAVDHVRVRVQPEAAEDVQPGTVEREVVAVVEVGVGRRRDVDGGDRLVERIVVEGVQLHGC